MDGIRDWLSSFLTFVYFLEGFNIIVFFLFWSLQMQSNPRSALLWVTSAKQNDKLPTSTVLKHCYIRQVVMYFILPAPQAPFI